MMGYVAQIRDVLSRLTVANLGLSLPRSGGVDCIYSGSTVSPWSWAPNASEDSDGRHQ